MFIEADNYGPVIETTQEGTFLVCAKMNFVAHFLLNEGMRKNGPVDGEKRHIQARMPARMIHPNTTGDF